MRCRRRSRASARRSNDLARELGGALGIATVASVVSSVYRDRFIAPDGTAPGILERAKESFAMATNAGGSVGEAGRTAFVDGMHAGMLVASAASLVAAVVVACLMPRRERRRKATWS